MRIAFLGYGTVGRALYALLARRRAALSREYGIDYVVTGVASRRGGWRVNAAGLEPEQPTGEIVDNVTQWLERSAAEVVFEALPLEPMSGQPALDYLRAAIEHGVHVISANKGPVVHGHRLLTELAAARGVCYRFESAVMDGAPVFSLARACIPLAGVRSVRGIFTSTATVVLEAIESGHTLDEGIGLAQRMGIAEADPGYDVDGWDSAMKLCAVANVVLGADIRPSDVTRAGIRELREADVRRARLEGSPFRLVGEISRGANGVVAARVGPERCAADGPLGAVRGTTLVMHYEADVFPGGLTVTSHDPDPTTTAYGMMADLIGVMGTPR